MLEEDMGVGFCRVDKDNGYILLDYIGDIKLQTPIKIDIGINLDNDYILTNDIVGLFDWGSDLPEVIEEIKYSLVDMYETLFLSDYKLAKSMVVAKDYITKCIGSSNV